MPPNSDPFDAALPPAEIDVFLWPENVRAWGIWRDVQTQWRTGVCGATGLDYTAVCAYLTEEGMQGDERRETFASLRAAEQAFLQAADIRRQNLQNQQQSHQRG